MSGLASVTRGISWLLLVTTLAACEAVSGPPEPCLAIAEPAISVTTRNAETGGPIGDVLVVARDGAYVDSARTAVLDGAARAAGVAHERTGTYDVTAEKQGFTVWSRAGVTVEQGECGPVTVELTARLRPLSY